jgi:ABC-type Fe3+ transport system substrate-binding protein
MFFGLSVFIATLLLQALPAFSASTPVGLGESLEQVVQLAKKEGKVRISASLEGDEIEIVLGGFYKKYPEIKVQYTPSTGVNSGEKILTEALAGHVEYDLMKVVYELQSKFIKSGVLIGPVDWQRYFPQTPKNHISPHGYLVGGSFYPRVMAYNPTLVPPERVPRKWEDCLDPYWKGKFVMDVRPATLLALYPRWGEQRVLEYAKRVKENQPIWQRGVNALFLLASGEFAMVCGAGYAPIRDILRKDPRANIRIAWPDEVPVGLNEALGILRGGESPNAALLLAGWLASEEAQKGYDRVGRGSPFLEGTEAWKDIQKARAKPYFNGWNEGEYAPALTKKITAVWGLTSKK